MYWILHHHNELLAIYTNLVFMGINDILLCESAARSAKWTSGLVCEVIASAAKNTS